jgi:hypothetical protein
MFNPNDVARCALVAIPTGSKRDSATTIPQIGNRYGGESTRYTRSARTLAVMPGLVPGIHVLLSQQERRGWPGQARP